MMSVDILGYLRSLTRRGHCLGNGIDELFPARIFPEEGSVEVVLGSSHVVKGSGGVQQRIVVAEVIMHEGHDPLTLAHDLALLRLATPADVGSEVSGNAG